MQTVISEYRLDQAIADGVLSLLGIFCGQPIVVTASVKAEISNLECMDLIQAFLDWQRDIEPSLAEEDRMFSTKASNSKTVWVIDDGAVITLLYPEDY